MSEVKSLSTGKKVLSGGLKLLGQCLLAMLVFYFFVVYALSRADFTYNNWLIATGNEAEKVFISKGICQAKHCGGEIYFLRPIRSGGEVTIYGVTDQKSLSEFSNYFVSKFAESPDMRSLSIIARINPHKANLEYLFSRNRIIYKLNVEK